MTTPPTILAVKQTFLEQETRRLALPLVPSRAWQRANSERRSSRQVPDDDGGGGAGAGAKPRPLPDKAVDDALFRANQLLRQHVRRVYAPQAVRHVAEQLDQLYWQAGERAVPDDDVEEEGDGVSGPLDVGADLTKPALLAALPAAWEDADVGAGPADAKAEAEALPLEAGRYAELVAQLQMLSARQQATAARVRRLRRLAAMVEPFREEEDEGEHKDGSLQDGVVTRNGPVERELERMRLLLARVSDRVAVLQREDGAGAASASAMQVDDDVEAAGQRRVQALLDQF